ncbi:hypothetical protein P3H15_32805 [Rhodococcus sp. T2V]|uniref:hypothetical protein n=1 Tax=Rhodococcus sp. T2V TaxID=3034164 RepID=UPI0023E1085D|nr:hypothetical protein [Rhodococcus sp. T2V]MDF3309801.1 hypothetical protein [Rhodococcus sp. T2V]
MIEPLEGKILGNLTAQATDSTGDDTLSLAVRVDTVLDRVEVLIHDGICRDSAYLDRVGVQSLIVQLERAQLELDAPVPAPVLGGIRDLVVDLFETASFAANMGAALAMGLVKAAIK